MTRERELEKALRKLADAIWDSDIVDPPKRVNDAYIAARNLLAKIDAERASKNR